MRHALGVWSLALIGISAWFLFAGFTLDTTVPAEAGTTLPAGMQGVSNLQLMHIQLVDIIIGCVSGLGACVLFAGAAVTAAIQDKTSPTP
jgi:hypothetical protein